VLFKEETAPAPLVSPVVLLYSQTGW